MRVESRLPDASPNKSTALICAGLGLDPTQDFLFGAYDYGNARNGQPRFISGNLLLDNFLIYDRSLTAAEVDAIAHSSVTAAVPEQSTWLLFATGICGCVGYRLRKRGVGLK